MLQTDLHTGDIPNVFARFRDKIGERHWQRRITRVKEDIRGNRFLRQHLIEDNAIAFALTECSNLTVRYKQIPTDAIETRALYPALSFAAQVLSIIDRSSTQQAKGLIRRIQGAFNNPDDMRALRLELTAATHFTKRGYAIAWPEMESSGTFDLLIKDISNNGLEVECKSVSRDKGRKIHRRDALEFWHIICPQLEEASRTLHSGLAVVLTVPGRLPKSFQHRSDLARRVIASVLQASDNTFEDGTHVRIVEFDAALLGDVGVDGRPAIGRVAIDQVTSTRNREVMVVGRRSSGAIALVLQSADDDSLLEYVLDTMARAAKEQLTKTRPGLLLTGLHDIQASELIDLARQDFNFGKPPTALRIAVSSFLSSQNRDHVIGVGFLSRTELMPEADGNVASRGSAYLFPRRESRFWHEDFSGMFS